MAQPEIATWTFDEMLEMVMDPNILSGTGGNYEVEFMVKGGPLVVRTRDLSPGRADLEGGLEITDLLQATAFLTELTENDVSFTSSVKKGTETIKFLWVTR